MSSDPRPPAEDHNDNPPADPARASAADSQPAGAQRPGAEAPEPGSMMPGDEVQVWTGRPSWWNYSSGAFLGLIVSVALVVVMILFHNKDWWGAWTTWTGLILIGLLALYVFGKAAIKVLKYRYRITSQRLFAEIGIFSKTIEQIELIRVDDVRVRLSLFDRIFGIGDIRVMSTDASDPEFVIEAVPQPRTVAEHLRSNMRMMRSKKSLFVERL